jgi:hypothetical protein
MPKFLDHHPTVPNMPPEAMQQLRAKLESRQPDEYGVVGLNMFMGGEETWCYAEAPNPDAIHRAHEAMGVTLGAGDVIEVKSVI